MDQVSARVNIEQRNQQYFVLIMFFFLVSFFVVSFLYLKHSNAVATKGYEIKRLQEEQSYLESSLETWNLKKVKLMSLDNLKKQEKIIAMQKAEHKDYLNTGVLASLK
jgi:hypothetical protein